MPPSEVPLERASKTQPFPLKPPPLARMTMRAADIATVTPELEAACKELIEGVQMGGPYLPVSYNRLRVQFPGNHGGVNWGGTSFNPQLGYLFVNTNELGQTLGREGSRSEGRPGQWATGWAIASIRMVRTRACRAADVSASRAATHSNCRASSRPGDS